MRLLGVLLANLVCLSSSLALVGQVPSKSKREPIPTHQFFIVGAVHNTGNKDRTAMEEDAVALLKSNGIRAVVNRSFYGSDLLMVIGQTVAVQRRALAILSRMADLRKRGLQLSAVRFDKTRNAWITDFSKYVPVDRGTAINFAGPAAGMSPPRELSHRAPKGRQEDSQVQRPWKGHPCSRALKGRDAAASSNPTRGNNSK